MAWYILGRAAKGRMMDAFGEFLENADTYRDGNGRLMFKPTTRTWVACLKFHPQWRGKLRHNRLSNQIELVGDAPWNKTLGTQDADRPLSRNDMVRVEAWFESADLGGMRKPPHVRLWPLVTAAAESNERDQIEEWLLSLPAWDGESRIAWFWQRYVDVVAETDVWATYLEIATRFWFHDAVARILGGSTNRPLLMFEVPRGGHTLQLLFGEGLLPDSRWFKTLTVDDSNLQVLAAQISGTWIVEWPECNRFADLLLRGRCDMARKGAQAALAALRRVVVAGSTRGITLSRERWLWPLRLRTGDVRWYDLARERDQVWAEALAIYRSKSGHAPTLEEERDYFEPARKRRFGIDPGMYDAIATTVLDFKKGERITTKDALQLWCNMRISGGISRAERAMVRDIMTLLGFEYGKGGWRKK